MAVKSSSLRERRATNYACLVNDCQTIVEQLRNARRIHVTGNVAAGKSTLARSIGFAFGLPIAHMDHMVWAPGWVKRPDEERQASVSSAVANQSWVIDGVSDHVRGECDALVFIDLPTWVALRRAISRIFRLRRGHRPELDDRFPEWRAARPALRLARRFNRRVRPRIVEDLAGAPVAVRLASAGDVAALNRELRQFAKGGAQMDRTATGKIAR